MATGSGELPPELDPRHWRQTGAQVLESGPPELPSQLTHQMWIPLCGWAGECCGVVAFMLFSPDHGDGHMRAMTTLMPYTRKNGRWLAPQGNSFHGGSSSNNGFDPLSNPDDRRHLDGSTITYGMFSSRDSHHPGHPACTAFGHVSPEVKYLAVIQDGQQDYRALNTHFGTYLVCVEKPGPFDVAAFDANGKLVDVLQYPHPMHRLHRQRSANT